MRTHTVELFSITELDEEAQEKAVDYLREHDYFGVENEHIEERFKSMLEEYGLPTDNIEFSLGHRQGDGVAFYGNMDTDDIVKMLYKVDARDFLPYGANWRRYRPFVQWHGLSATIQRNSHGNHYSHYNTMDVYVEREREYTQQPTRLAGKEVWDLIKENVVKVSKELEKLGYEMIDEYQKKEWIIEQAEANEMEFRKDGRLWGG